MEGRKFFEKKVSLLFYFVRKVLFFFSWYNIFFRFSLLRNKSEFIIFIRLMLFSHECYVLLLVFISIKDRLCVLCLSLIYFPLLGFDREMLGNIKRKDILLQNKKKTLFLSLEIENEGFIVSYIMLYLFCGKTLQLFLPKDSVQWI